MWKIQGYRGIIVVSNRRVRVEQIVQRDLNPITGICPKNERNRFFTTTYHIMGLFHGYENQPPRVMIAKAVVNKILLNGGNFKFADDRARRRLRRGELDAYRTAAAGFPAVRHTLG